MKLVIDRETPLNVKLSGKYKRSFAYPSLKDRVPIILTKIVDYLSRDKATIINCYGQDVKDEIKEAIGGVSRLKYHLQTSKKFEYFTSDESDTEIWNSHLKRKEEEENESITYFQTDWLFAECYIYKSVREVFATKKLLRTLDPFSAQKTDLLKSSIPILEILLRSFTKKRIFDSETVLAFSQLQKEFKHFIKLSLWANRFDLSLKIDGKVNENFLNEITEWDDNILVDDSAKIFSTIYGVDNTEKIVDIVTDNAGIEIICDLCLADFLISKFHFNRINFRVKPYPWYVSDVIQRDFCQTVSSIICSPDEDFQSFGKRWQKYLDTGIWRIFSDQYWCLGKDYSNMKTEDPNLYTELQNSSLIIMKGDLNYRKLVQDINWEPTEPFYKVLGNFHPAPILALRTCKSDVICGLEPGIAERVSEKHKDWLRTGDFGVIQYDSFSCQE